MGLPLFGPTPSFPRRGHSLRWLLVLPALLACESGAEDDADAATPPGDATPAQDATGEGDATSGDADAATGADAASDATTADASSGMDAASDADAADAPDGSDAESPPPCGGDCDDGVDCTVDTCMNDVCVHRVDPGMCPEGQSCDLAAGGCTAGSACGDVGDCEADPCAVNLRCEGTPGACVFEPLDADGDGLLPLECGGSDCDDDDDNVGPGQPERCNGRDDDCDGSTDEQVTCRGDGLVCMNPGTEQAECACPGALTQCNDLYEGPRCVDTQTDPRYCGDCIGSSCGSGGVCTDGACSCPATARTCTVEDADDVCADVSKDPGHCGECGNACIGAEMVRGLCIASACVDCGALGQPCCPVTSFGTSDGCPSGNCTGSPGSPTSMCEACGTAVGQPCCETRLLGSSLYNCGNAEETGLVCGDDRLCGAAEP